MYYYLAVSKQPANPVAVVSSVVRAVCNAASFAFAAKVNVSVLASITKSTEVVVARL